MAIEYAHARAVPKPWGVEELHPWSTINHDGDVIGEIWYEPSNIAETNPSLLLKLLFTSQPLSIQVHPDDAVAHTLGLPRGKSEAWYVLSATSDAKVALGLSRHLTPQQLRRAIDDGSISDLVVWRAVSANDVIFVPAGTIHAIGAGLVIVEIQQRGDATFRLFDFGRQRELQVEDAIVVANAGPADFQVRPSQLTAERRMLVASPHFVFERIELAPNSSWRLDADRETWFLVLAGSGVAGTFDAITGDALFAQADRVDIRTGAMGLIAVVAYTGNRPIPNLLQHLPQAGPINAGLLNEMQVPLAQVKILPKAGRADMIK